MKRNIISLLTIVMVMMLFISSCSGDKKIVPPQDAIDSVKSEIAMFKKYLPIEGGVGMIITAVDYDNATYTIKYKYQYTVPGVKKPSETQIKEAKDIAVDLMKKQAKEKKLIEQGFTFRYDYFSLEDDYLFTQEITAQDLTSH